MHYIVRQSLLASIQTVRSVLLGMETLVKSLPDDSKTSQPQINHIVPQTDDVIRIEDEKELAKKLGLVFEVPNDNE